MLQYLLPSCGDQYVLVVINNIIQNSSITMFIVINNKVATDLLRIYAFHHVS